MAGLQKHGYWIHKKIRAEHSVTGYVYERQCTCSNCGEVTNMEKKVCPSCGAIMDQSDPGEKK